MPFWVILLLLFLASQGYGFQIQGKSPNTLSQRMSDRAQEDEAGWTTVPDNSQGRSQLQNGRRRPRNDKWSGNPPVVEPIPQDDSNCQFEPFMLLLAGLPGCGKSTFARMLVEAMPYKVRMTISGKLGTRSRNILTLSRRCHILRPFQMYSLLESIRTKWALGKSVLRMPSKPCRKDFA